MSRFPRIDTRFLVPPIPTRQRDLWWMRLGFVYSIDSHLTPNPCSTVLYRGARKPSVKQSVKQSESSVKSSVDASVDASVRTKCDECTLHSTQHVAIQTKRFPLFGRQIDSNRYIWEYYVYDSQNDIRIPIYLPPRVMQLFDGDVVTITGEPNAYRVSLVEENFF
jgi:hypothetical protein